MSTDLHRALTEIADQVEHLASPAPVGEVIGRRRRRRIAVRSAGAGGLLVVAAGVAVAVSGLTGLRPAPVTPATPDPTPSATTTPAPMPGCGDPVDDLPVRLALAAPESFVAGADLTGEVAPATAAGLELTQADAYSMSLLLVRDGTVVAEATPDEDHDGDGEPDPTTGADQAVELIGLTATPTGCTGSLTAGEYQLVAVLDRADEGAMASAPVPVTLTAPAEPDDAETADNTDDSGQAVDAGAPLPDPYTMGWSGEDLISDTPGATWPLADGRYLISMENLDPTSRSFDATMFVFYGGAPAKTWAAANDPQMLWPNDDGTNYIPNGFVMADTAFGTQRVTVPTDAAIVVAVDTGEGMVLQDRTLAQLADPSSRSGIWESHDEGSFYWIDIRGGEIRQLVGQFIP